MNFLVAITFLFGVPATTSFVRLTRTKHCSSMLVSSPGLSEDDSFGDKLPTQKGKKLSESIPFVECPPVLRDSDLAGNVGFDPLGLAKNKEQLWEYREAEIKHARLAMLVSVVKKS